MSIDDFTYEKPNEPAFLNTLIRLLRMNNEKDIADLLEGGMCSIQTSGSFSGKRWNAFWTKIYFSIPVERLALVDDEMATRLVEYCHGVIPPSAGLDVMEIEFLPLITEAETPQTLAKALEEVAGSLSKVRLVKSYPTILERKEER